MAREYSPVATKERDKKPNNSLVETIPIHIEDDDLVGVTDRRIRRNTAQWPLDLVLLLINHLQLFSLILSLSLSWPWPISWIRGTSVFLFFNLDLWEFTKIHSVYQGRNHAFEDPNSIPFSYYWYASIWLIIAILTPLLFTILYIVTPRLFFLSPISALLLRARLIRTFLIIAQVAAIPFGLVVVRLFDCQHYTSMENGMESFRSIVLKNTKCFSSSHVGLSAPLLLLAIIYYTVVPAWMIHSIRKQLILPLVCTCRTWQTHESHLLLTEAEYKHGLGVEWEINHYSLFSSFRRPWVWYHPITFITKFIILVIYGGLFYTPFYQAVFLFSLIAIACLVTIILPVYRLTLFNLMLPFSIFVNLCNVTLGLLQVLQVQNALLVGQYLLNALIVINVVWAIAAVCFICYLFVRASKPLQKRFGPIWPALFELDSTSRLRSEHTKKFFKAILKGRKLIEKSYSCPAFFAPVHELSKHIKIVNAFCREAELLEDPVHASLWALLAEMVDLHTELAPQSIYGTSTKDTVPYTVQNLMALMPDFRERLDQREYDLILWTPKKRRILLKLLAVATFLKKDPARIGNLESHRASLASQTSHASTLTFLNDNTEQKNDEFLMDIEKWEMERERYLANNRYRTASIGSLRSYDDGYDQEVTLWESQRDQDGGLVRSQYGYHRSQSAGSNDSILSEGSGFWNQRASRPRSNLSVRFNLLDTISEYDSSRPVSSQTTLSRTSTDRFIESIDEQFPQFQYEY